MGACITQVCHKSSSDGVRGLGGNTQAVEVKNRDWVAFDFARSYSSLFHSFFFFIFVFFFGKFTTAGTKWGQNS